MNCLPTTEQVNEWFYSPDCRKKEYSIQQKDKKEKEKKSIPTIQP